MASGDSGKETARIVVGVDGSDCSIAALRWAERIAGATGTKIDASADADMLVVGSRGHGGFVGLLLGSVSANCAERASCPVVVVHRPASADR